MQTPTCAIIVVARPWDSRPDRPPMLCVNQCSAMHSQNSRQRPQQHKAFCMPFALPCFHLTPGSSPAHKNRSPAYTCIMLLRMKLSKIIWSSWQAWPSKAGLSCVAICTRCKQTS
jgi:hypothetical protein